VDPPVPEPEQEEKQEPSARRGMIFTAEVGKAQSAFGIEFVVSKVDYAYLSDGSSLADCSLVARKGGQSQKVLLVRNYAKEVQFVPVFDVEIGLEDVKSFGEDQNATLALRL